MSAFVLFLLEGHVATQVLHFSISQKQQTETGFLFRCGASWFDVSLRGNTQLPKKLSEWYACKLVPQFLCTVYLLLITEVLLDTTIVTSVSLVSAVFFIYLTVSLNFDYIHFYLCGWNTILDETVQPTCQSFYQTRPFLYRQVMLWVVATLLTVVEDVFSEKVNKEAQSDLQHVLRHSSWSPAEDLERDDSVHTSWPNAFGEYFILSLTR